MKKIMIVISIIFVIVLGIFLGLKNQSSYTYDFNAVANKLKAIKQIDDTMVVIKNGELVSEANFREFMKNTDYLKADEMTVAHILPSGEITYTHIHYNGERFYTVTDDSRVEGTVKSEQIHTFSGKYLKSENNGERIIYFLTDDGSLTYSEISKYMYSSMVYEYFPKFRLLFSLDSELPLKEKYEAIQNSADNGHFPWRLKEFEVAREYAKKEFKWEDIDIIDYKEVSDGVLLRVSNPYEDLWEFYLYQPVRKGKGGIWVVRDVKPLTYEATLYFADKDCQHLIPEKRLILLKENSHIEHEIVKEVLRGPQTHGLFSAVAGDVTVISTAFTDGNCTVTLSKEFLKHNTQGTARETMAIYSIVNSLCNLETIDRVKFQFEDNTEYNGHYDILGYFEPDYSFIKEEQ